MPLVNAYLPGVGIVRRLWILALASTVLASPAAAQFTTFIAPPSPLKDSIKTAAVTQRLVADSITRSQITDMKTWVDSAAGLPQLRPADTVVKKDTTPAVTTAVSNGVIAPQTASSLPLLLVIGVVTMLMGASLVRRRPPSRADC
jgi:hypothetical protein